jgi:uncharacterized protein with beta-barrel porin domain
MALSLCAAQRRLTLTQVQFIHPALRAVRMGAALLTLAAPLLVAGCAGVDGSQNSQVVDSSGSTVPNASTSPLKNGYPFGYW